MENNTPNQESATTEVVAFKSYKSFDPDGLKKLADDYKGLIVTRENLKESNDARLKLRRVRLDIQKVEKENKDTLNNFKKVNSEKAENLIGIVKPTEDRLDADISRIEEEMKRKEEEARQKELLRIQGHKKAILEIESKMPAVRSATSNEVLDKIALEVSSKENSFEEFNEDGNAMITQVLKSIENRKLFIEEERKAEELKKQKQVEEEAKKKSEENTTTEPVNDTHHPHETGEGIVDNPDDVKEFEEEAHPDFKEEEAKAPFNRTAFGPGPVARIDYSYGGYTFTYPESLPAIAQEKLKAAIAAHPFLEAHYDVGIDYLRGRNGTEFIFRGLRHNAGGIKSLAKIDLTIVEEAEDVTEDSWLALEATVFRQPKSELWAIWNPRLDGSPVDKRFIKTPPKNALIAKVNYHVVSQLAGRLLPLAYHGSQSIADRIDSVIVSIHDITCHVSG